MKEEEENNIITYFLYALLIIEHKGSTEEGLPDLIFLKNIICDNWETKVNNSNIYTF